MTKIKVVPPRKRERDIEPHHEEGSGIHWAKRQRSMLSDEVRCAIEYQHFAEQTRPDAAEQQLADEQQWHIRRSCLR
ncbi:MULTISPECIES: hypothetical protein [Rhizobium]|uniref:hypothetical protein n=1 Tax=Rhizobium TaxID=379 RepID=UPI0013EE8760|nr:MULTISPECIES: hypothetical protein [Rhizobium]NZD51947.1 hypothetical protein [Rhizobium leguminosarum]QIO51790.1 hypothetical protein HA461_11625 [Rhizobium leguminosarum bv. trifolii]QJX05287.1 hypothetical protein RLCC275e_10170 [Rhizobium brockwellii]